MSPIPEQDNPNRGHGEGDEIGSVETPQVMIAAGSSEDEDEEFAGFQGYQPLPQDPDSEMEAVPSHDDATEDSSAGAASVTGPNIDNVLMHVMDSQAFDNAPGGNIFDVSADTSENEIKELWNAPRPKETSHELPMDEDQAEKVIAAMSGFKLPQTCYPSWASMLSEDEWKAQVLQKIRTDKPKPDNAELQQPMQVLFEADFSDFKEEPVPSGSGESEHSSATDSNR